MTSDRVSTSQQRQRIPTEWQVVFNDWSNASLESLAEDMNVDPHVRAYARWEAEFREANGVMVNEGAPELVDNPRMIPGPDGPRPSVLNEIVKRLKPSSIPAASR